MRDGLPRPGSRRHDEHGRQPLGGRPGDRAGVRRPGRSDGSSSRRLGSVRRPRRIAAHRRSRTSAGRDGELRRRSGLRRRSRCRSARGRGRRRHRRRGCRRHPGGCRGHGRRRVPDDGAAVQHRAGSERGHLRCSSGSSSDHRRGGPRLQGCRGRSRRRCDGGHGRLGRRDGRRGRGRLAARRRCEVGGRRSGRCHRRRARQRRRCRCGRGPCRKQAERIDVALRVGRAADPELHVGRVAAAVGKGADCIALGDDGILLDPQLAEVRERH